MPIVNHRNLYFTIVGVIVAASIAAIAFFGLPLSIDFTGGSLVEVSYPAGHPALDDLKSSITAAGLKDYSLRESGTNGVVVRAHTLSPEEHNTLLTALSLGSTTPASELRSTSIGPSLGSELAIKALYALGAVILAIMLYIAWAFRRVSRPVSSWIYGAIVVLVLIHDVLVPTGFYALYAHFAGAEVDTLFVVALLAILGYSVNDTIVIFDRVREHLRMNQEKNVKEEFDVTVGKSIMETLGRSINTSVTVALALLALVFVGSPATFGFALVLIAGVVAGTYSSIFVAAPLLIPLAHKFAKK